MTSSRLLILTLFLLVFIGLVMAVSLRLFRSDDSLDSLRSSSSSNTKEHIEKRNLAKTDAARDAFKHAPTSSEGDDTKDTATPATPETTQDGIDLTLIDGVRISGLILLPNGSPAIAANVAAYQLQATGGNQRRGPQRVSTANSNQEGHFSMLLQTGNYRLAVKHAEAAILVSDKINVTEQGHGGIVLSLLEGAHLSGDIWDAHGKRLASTLVLSRSWNNDPSDDNRDTWDIMEDYPPMPLPADSASYSSNHIQAGLYLLQVLSENHVPKHINVSLENGEHKVLDITLNEGINVTIRVLDETDTPLPDAQVYMQFTDWKAEDRTNANGITDAAGHYLATTLVPGLYSLSVALPGYLQQKLNVTIQGDETLDVRLQRSPKLLVQAQDAETNRFLDTYTIRLTTSGANNQHAGETFPVANHPKPFEIEFTEQYSSLSIEASGYPPSSTIRIKETDLNSDQVLVISMVKGGGVRGRIVSATGDPVEKAQVHILTSSQTQSLMSTVQGYSGIRSEEDASKRLTDADGYFEVSGILPGDNLTVAILHAKFPTMKHTGIAVKSGMITDVGTLHAPKGATLQGHVFDDKGLPKPGTTIRAMSLSGGGSKLATTDDQGYYVISSITSGNLMVGLQGRLNETTRRIEVKEDETSTLDFGGKRGTGKLILHLTINGEPFTDTVILIPMFGHSTSFITIPLKDNVHTSEPLDDGTYLLWAARSAGKMFLYERTFTIRAGRSVEHTADIHTGTLVLTVTDDAGQTIPGLNITDFPRSIPRYRSWLKNIGTLSPDILLPDTNSQYTIEYMPQGDHDLVISAPGYKSELVTRFPISAQSDNLYNTRLQKLNSPGSIEVNLVGKDGLPSSTLMIMSLCTRGGTPLYRSHDSAQDALGNAEANYLISQVPAGQYVLKLSPVSPGPALAQEVTITAAQELELTLVEPETGSLRVTVLTTSGTVLQDADIQLINDFGHELTFRFYLTAMKILPTFTDSDGQWGFKHLAPGSYKITAINSRGKRITETINIQSGQETAITLQIP